MKKILLLLTVFSMVFASCDPMEDINKELDGVETVIVGEAEFTLTDADYDDLGLNFTNFGSTDEAKSMIPGHLSEKYPVWGKNSSALVTFSIYNKKNDEKSLIVYEAKSSDYTDAGLRYSTISSDAQMTQLLDYLYPSPANRVLVSLTYKKYDSGITTTENDGYIYSNGAWEKAIGISEDEYKSMGEARAQFSSHDEAEVKIPVYLKNKMAYNSPASGDIEGVMYKLYVTDTQDVDNDGKTTDRTVYSYVVFYIYDGTAWTAYNNTITETIQFGHDGTSWVPDNTIKYTLTQADYDLVGNGNYGNFDVRTGRDEETEEARVAKINTILLNNFPADAEGQKYIVTYNIYNGANGIWELAVIKTGGAYVKQ